MSNQDIRRWAREAIKGNIGFLVLASFICSFPTLMGSLISYFSPDFLAAPWEWALDFVSNFMRLGEICVILKLIHTGQQDLTALATPFRPQWAGKALCVALVLSLWSAVHAALPDEGLLGLVFTLVGLVISTALFPVPYVLFFWPDWPAGQVIGEGFRAGYADFWDILGFQIVLCLPLLGIIFLMVLSPLFGVLAVPCLIGGVVAIVAWGAYATLAQTKYAMERFMN